MIVEERRGGERRGRERMGEEGSGGEVRGEEGRGEAWIPSVMGPNRELSNGTSSKLQIFSNLVNNITVSEQATCFPRVFV